MPLLSIYNNVQIIYSQINHSHSKGIGIYSLTNITKNSLIAPYLGIIYPIYLWYEKQDLIKQKKLDKNLPDFYNILLERNKNDSEGYDLIMIDPNSKGNFASRMSHSCTPNCNTVLMISNNEYKIGMYATKDIEIGEELTFDYNSVTEKEKEFIEAICLCGSFECRGHYLGLGGSFVFTEVINEYHGFLARNAVLLKSCCYNNDNNENFNQKNNEDNINYGDEDILKKYGIGNSLLGNSPQWLKNWARNICYFIEIEKFFSSQLVYNNIYLNLILL